ncbi:MAG: sulfatase-like hydrolase/transferase, partial [Gammaproteobacteria bacterium]
MKTATSVVTFVAFALVGCGRDPEMPVSDAEPVAEETQSQPNLLLLVADDMGYTDLGAYGSEIRTPHIDGLAEQSIKLTNFHVAPTCAPTRSMILSGTDNHTAGLGSMFGSVMLSGVEGVPGYELYLHERVATLPE